MWRNGLRHKGHGERSDSSPQPVGQKGSARSSSGDKAGLKSQFCCSLAVGSWQGT